MGVDPDQLSGFSGPGLAGMLTRPTDKQSISTLLLVQKEEKSGYCRQSNKYYYSRLTRRNIMNKNDPTQRHSENNVERFGVWTDRRIDAAVL